MPHSNASDSVIKDQIALHERTAGLVEAFGLAMGEVVSLVGAGGKTTLMYTLARELAKGGRLTVTTTTTKVQPPSTEESEAVWLDGEEVLLQKAAQNRGRCGVVTLARRKLDSGKLEGVSPELVDRLASLAGLSGIIVEADGSARRPLKAPNATEPVIPASTRLVIAVVGMQALGSVLDDTHVFRASIAAEILGAPMGSRIGADEIARLITHPRGIAKGTPSKAWIVPFLNQVDLGGDLTEARSVATAVLAARHPQVLRVVVGEARQREFLIIGVT